MDRRVKERLVGATLLVVLLVLIVPELLSGPHRLVAEPPALTLGPVESARNGTVRNVTVDLATRRATPSPEMTSASAASPPAVIAPASVAEPIREVVRETEATVPTVHPDPPARETQVSHPGWAVQIGSFASRSNADKLVQQLKNQESSAYLSASGRGGSMRYRVRIGPLADRGAAERVLAQLKKQRHSASLVPP